MAEEEVKVLLESEVHEHRLAAVYFLIQMYEHKKATDVERRLIFDFYLDHTHRINSWDLVDLSAHKIVGHYMFEHSFD